MAKKKTSDAVVALEEKAEILGSLVPPMDFVLCFDTTGSMSSAIQTVRRQVKTYIQKLFSIIPDVRIAIIGHGDYCDRDLMITASSYEKDEERVTNFLQKVPNTGGGDFPECYEAVLNYISKNLAGDSTRKKILIMIGDAVPHPPTERQNKDHLDWKKEKQTLKTQGFIIYAVQALNRSQSTSFWKSLGDYHLHLDQFEDTPTYIRAILSQQKGKESLIAYEQEVQEKGTVTRSLRKTFSILKGEAPTEEITYSSDDTDETLKPVPPQRFQKIHIRPEDIAGTDPSDGNPNSWISKFVRSQGLPFIKGRGFYQVTKAETVQATKEVILLDPKGDFYSGAAARKLCKLPKFGTISARIHKKDLPSGMIVFINSTSNNRVLQEGTDFLYEMEGWKD